MSDDVITTVADDVAAAAVVFTPDQLKTAVLRAMRYQAAVTRSIYEGGDYREANTTDARMQREAWGTFVDNITPHPYRLALIGISAVL